MTAPRVAFLPDSFHEVNGVAHTSRNFTAYAQRKGLPFLCIRAAAPGTRGDAVVSQQGSVTAVDLPRGPASIAMEKDLSFDPLFFRHRHVISQQLRAFQPDVIHMTGPSEMGIFAAFFAWRLGVPLAASWHTNVHEYAGRRSQRLGTTVSSWMEQGALEATSRFYRLAKVLYAPNEELCALLTKKTGKPCNIMRRGVDTEMFTPARRTRQANDRTIVLGYVGRLSVEKQVSMLPAIDRALREAGMDARFNIVGHGEEEAALRKAMPTADFAGVLRGEALARAYADMDLFVFPSETDTFGNVVLEALASGVPAAVTAGGGPKFIVRDGVTGVVRTAADLPSAVFDLARSPERLAAMRGPARDYALTCRWDAIFDDVYAGYAPLARPPVRPATAV